MSIAERTACSASSEYGGRRSEYGSRAGGAIENSTGELDIFPCGAFPRRIPKERRRVIGDYERNAVVTVHLTAQLPDRGLGIEKSLRCKCLERTDDLRLYQLELAHEVRTARLDLIRRWIPVSRRPVLHDVGYEDFLTRKVYCRENLRQQTAGSADERPTGLILSRAGRLADTNEPGLRGAFTGYAIVCRLVERAAGARLYRLGDRLE